MTSANTTLPEPHVLVSAALYLMTQHAQSRCPGLCRAIAQQLAWLARHPAHDIPAQQRSLYRRLAEQWGDMAAGANPHTTNRDMLVVGPRTRLQ